MLMVLGHGLLWHVPSSVTQEDSPCWLPPPHGELAQPWLPCFPLLASAKDGATLVCPHSQETSTNARTFPKGWSQKYQHSPRTPGPPSCLFHAIFCFSRLSGTFPCPDPMTISQGICPGADGLNKGPFCCAPLFSSPHADSFDLCSCLELQGVQSLPGFQQSNCPLSYL